MMIAFVVLVVMPVTFLLEALLVKWFCWALYDVGYLSHALTYSEACTVTLPLFVASALGALLSLDK